MADTQVDSGSEISAKVRTIWPRTAPQRLTRILPKPSPQVGAYLRSGYRIGSARMFGKNSPGHIFKGIGLFERCELPREASRHRFLGPSCVRSLSREQSARVLCLSDGLVLFLESRTPGPDRNTYTPRSPVHGFNSHCYLTCVFIPHLFRVTPMLVSRCARGSAGRCRGVQYRFSK